MRQVASAQTHDVLRPLRPEEAVLPSAARLHQATLRDVTRPFGGVFASLADGMSPSWVFGSRGGHI